MWLVELIPTCERRAGRGLSMRCSEMTHVPLRIFVKSTSIMFGYAVSALIVQSHGLSCVRVWAFPELNVDEGERWRKAITSKFGISDVDVALAANCMSVPTLQHSASGCILYGLFPMSMSDFKLSDAPEGQGPLQDKLSVKLLLPMKSDNISSQSSLLSTQPTYLTSPTNHR